jgi:hypothetical protein
VANLSTYLDNKLLDHALGEGSYTEPTCYVALYTTTPTMPAATGGTEVTGGSYARVALASLMAAASSGSIANSGVITFTTATAAWGTVLGVGVCDASTGGNILMAGALGTSAVIASGDTFSIPIGDLTAALS